MTDLTTNKPLRVRNLGTEWPYVTVPFTQLDEIRAILDGKGIKYEVDELIISLDDGPEMVDINFGRKADAVKIQAVLDSVH